MASLSRRGSGGVAGAGFSFGERSGTCGFLLSVCLFLALAGCAGSGGMVKAEGPLKQNENEATIVFMRSTFVGNAISASIYEVLPAGTSFVGMIQNDTKVACNVSPGEHIFMVVSEAADFMKTNVAGNKTYYALVTPRPGLWKARFSFRPLRNNDLTGDDFADWDKSTQLVQAGPKALAWAKDNSASGEHKRAEYWPEWQSKSQIQRDSQTLNAGDGR